MHGQPAAAHLWQLFSCGFEMIVSVVLELMLSMPHQQVGVDACTDYSTTVCAAGSI